MFFLKINIIFVLILLISIDSIQCKWLLNWSEEFNEETIDQNKWRIADGCSDVIKVREEVNCYKNNANNIRLMNGTLVMTATEKESNRRLTSSRITTRQLFSNGKLEVRAAMPKGKYLFALLWMTPLDQEQFPRFTMINHKQKKFVENAVELDRYHKSSGSTENSDLDQFKYYSIEWNETAIDFHSSNGQVYIIHTNYFNGNYNNSAQLVLDIALGVGGSDFGNPIVHKNISNEWDCPSLIIDYIRYYQWTDEQLNGTIEKAPRNSVKASDICAELNVKKQIDNRPNWHLVWSDEFNGETVDTDQWLIENQVDKCEVQYMKGFEYVRFNFEEENCFTNHTSNIRQLNGTLVMIAKEEHKNNREFTSAWIKSKQDFSYGKLEVRAAMPKGKYLFSNIALYPGENKTGTDESVRSVWMMLHQQSDDIRNRIETRLKTNSLDMQTDYKLNDFHTYSVEWNEREMVWKFDSNVTQSFDTLGHFKINKYFNLDIMLGVGGRMFQEYDGLQFIKPILIDISHLWDCPSLIIDYVRYYQLLSNTDQQNIVEQVSPNRDEICSNLNEPKIDIISQ